MARIDLIDQQNAESAVELAARLSRMPGPGIPFWETSAKAVKGQGFW